MANFTMKRYLNCPIHKVYKETALEHLTSKGVFSFKRIIEELNFQAIEDSLRLDYVRRQLESEEFGAELIALSEAYFQEHSFEDEYTNPDKYLALGSGKKTAGYALVAPEMMHLVRKRAEFFDAISVGSTKKMNRIYRDAKNESIEMRRPSTQVVRRGPVYEAIDERREEQEEATDL